MPLPSDKIVTYKARETPSDPNSDVLIKHQLHITARSQNGNDISWSIPKLTFDQPGGGDWTDASPELGAWLVTHADPENPVASDFTSPPAMNGTALADAIGDVLTYSLTPGSCTPGESEMYGGNVSCNEYSYVAGSTTIAEEDEDEPAETDLDDPPS